MTMDPARTYLAPSPDGRWRLAAPLVGTMPFGAFDEGAGDGGTELELLAAPAHQDGRTGCMALLLYGIRAGSDPDEYAAFLREEDNPFFNRVEGISRYENWLARDGDVGGWRYVDFIYAAGPDELNAALGDPELQAFQAGWLDRWSLVPGAEDPAQNYCGAVFTAS
jgi:hypothetical protein